MGQFSSRTLISARFGVKYRASREDLESRRDWVKYDPTQFLGDVHVLGPIDMRGREIELSATRSWNPRSPLSDWEFAGATWRWPPLPSTP